MNLFALNMNSFCCTKNTEDKLDSRLGKETCTVPTDQGYIYIYHFQRYISLSKKKVAIPAKKMDRNMNEVIYTKRNSKYCC